MFFARPLRSASYEIRQFYDASGRSDDTGLKHILSELFKDANLKLDPSCLGLKVYKTSHGEMVLQRTEFKAEGYLLKLIPNKYFVFIHDNQRRIIPLCSHSQ